MSYVLPSETYPAHRLLLKLRDVSRWTGSRFVRAVGSVFDVASAVTARGTGGQLPAPRPGIGVLIEHKAVGRLMRTAREVIDPAVAAIVCRQIKKVVVTDPIICIWRDVPTGHGLPVEGLLRRPRTAIIRVGRCGNGSSSPPWPCCRDWNTSPNNGRWARSSAPERGHLRRCPRAGRGCGCRSEIIRRDVDTARRPAARI